MAADTGAFSGCNGKGYRSGKRRDGRVLAVVGTDTGVGKTEAVRALVSFLRRGGEDAVPIKPYVSGSIGERWEDLDRLGIEEKDYPPARFRAALSPYGAVRRGEPSIPISDVEEYLSNALRGHDWGIIEGIGGVMVPLDRQNTWLDLQARHSWPALLIARSGLGTLNHTLLTLEALRIREIETVGVVFADGTGGVTEEDARENAAIIAEKTAVAIRGIVPYSSDPGSAWACNVDWSGIIRSCDGCDGKEEGEEDRGGAGGPKE
ncbi:MAG: dethiobiotin synthase [Candidatus Hydrogenedentota bacterium]|nr:MAG: dethiobiotin synthase [Candidatus Hydrogenedentota bacterium]